MFHLRGWCLRLADIGEGETGLLLHRDALLRTLPRQGRYRVWVLDDLVPGFVLDRRRLVRVRTRPFTLHLAFSGLPTGDERLVLGTAELTAVVTNPALFSSHFAGQVEGQGLAAGLARATHAAMAGAAGSYAADDLCHGSLVAQRVASQVERSWRNLLTEQGMDMVHPPALVFTLQSRAAASLHHVGDLLARWDAPLSVGLTQELETRLGDDEAATGSLAEAVTELVEQQVIPTGPGDALQAKDPTTNRVLFLFSLAPILGGIAGGGLLVHGLDTVRSFLQGVPALGPVGGSLFFWPVSLVIKWTVGRIWGAPRQSQGRDRASAAKQRERNAWERAHLQRAEEDLRGAFAAFSTWMAREPRPAELRAAQQAASDQFKEALSLMGIGLLGRPKNQRGSVRESLVSTRFIVLARALLRVVERLASQQADRERAVSAVTLLAREASATLKEWQAFRLALTS
jgi:hypothetical protein